MSGDVHEVFLFSCSGSKFNESLARSPADGEENELQNAQNEVQAERAYISQKSKPCFKEGAGDADSFCDGQWSVYGCNNRIQSRKLETFRNGKKLVERNYGIVLPRYKDISCDMDAYYVDSNTRCSGNTTPSESGTPTYIKWAKDLQCVLQDLDGVNLFKEYLSQEKCEDSLDFWFACEGLKKADPTNVNYIQYIIKLIYKKFIRSKLVEIKPETREYIANKIDSKVGLDQTIFDDAQRNTEDIIRETTYPNFLKSELYLQHIQLMQQKAQATSQKLTEGSGSLSNDSRQGLEILPTLHEDVELNVNQSLGLATLAREPLKQQPRSMENVPHYRPEAQAGHYLHGTNKVPNPYHVKYSTVLPTSAQDSELQSLSSDALTDDTLSLTDGSSVECGPSLSSKNQLKRHRRAVKKSASLNRDHLAHQTIIPRTQRPPKEYMTPMHGEEFAAILTQKLLQVKKEREAQEKVEEALQKLEVDEEKTALWSCDSNMKSSVSRFASLPSQLITAAMKEKQTVTEENDQSILDQHVSRVWNDSAHHTPSRSPGLFSPPLRPLSPQLERRRSGIAGTSGINPFMSMRLSTSSLGGAYVSPYQSIRSYHNFDHLRRDRDTFSSDSGTVHDFTPDNELANYPTPPFHTYKHLYYHPATGSPLGMSRGVGTAPEQFSISSVDHQQNRHFKEMSRRSSSKKLSATDSSSSCIDSGVSVACDPIPSTLPSSEKVFHWMMDNEKESSTRHKKSGRSSLSSTSPVLGRQSHSKKPLAYNTSRSGFLERGGSIPWPVPLPLQTNGNYSKSHLHATTHPCHWGLQPTQPIALDLSMPILPQPDTATQLLEAKRRLEDETRFKSSKIKTSSSKDKQVHMDSSRGKISAKNFETMDESTAHSTRKSSKKTLSTAYIPGSHPTPSGDVTVIGYCFSGESVPYRTKLPGKNVTLKQFKGLLSKKGNYRYFFKKECNEFGTGVINEEISDDNEILPLWEGKIFATIESVD